MYLKGIKVHRAKHLAYRDGNTLTDIDGHGKPVQSNYIVIVLKKDCKVVDYDTHYYSSNNVKQSVVLKYGGTYYGYGKRRINKYKTYDTTPVYFVNDGFVYVGTIKHYHKSLEEIE